MEEREEWEKFYLTPKKFYCVILDVSKKREKLENCCLESAGGITYNYLKPDLDPDLFIELYEELKITPKDIKDIIGTKNFDDLFKDCEEELDGIIVVFKTLWNEYFYVTKGSLSHPMWEGWHAYLTYPFLPKDTVEYLLSQNVEGVGSDTPSLENFMYYTIPESEDSQRYIREAYPSLRDELKSELKGKNVNPLHYSFLKNKKYLIENLWNLGEVQMNQNRKFKLGMLKIIPYPIGTNDVPSGTIIRALLYEMTESED